MEENLKSPKNVINLMRENWKCSNITPEFHEKLSILLPGISITIGAFPRLNKHSRYYVHITHVSLSSIIVLMISSSPTCVYGSYRKVFDLTYDDVIESIKHTIEIQTNYVPPLTNKRRV